MDQRTTAVLCFHPQGKYIWSYRGQGFKPTWNYAVILEGGEWRREEGRGEEWTLSDSLEDSRVMTQSALTPLSRT
jgi:hypothetical protein